MKVLFSGIQPTGELHIGNYFGAIRNWVNIQKDYETYISVVDLHSITIPYDPKEMQGRIEEVVLELYACGIDFEETWLFVQSDVPGHADLTWFFNVLTPLGELERMTQFKDKAKQHRQNVNVGLLGYPVLQAADILLYKGEVVPVGEDQVQHIEFTREVARRFNSRFGPTFPECDALLTETPRIMGLDGDSKMSKSKGNTVGVLEEPESIWKKLAVAKTDPARKRRSDPGTPEKCNIYSYHRLVTDEAQLKEVHEGCTTAGIGCIDCKKALYENLRKVLDPIRQRYAELNADRDSVRKRLDRNADHCREIANATILEAKEKMGLQACMEDLSCTSEDLTINNLGKAKIESPLGLSTVFGDDIVNYVGDGQRILLIDSEKEVIERIQGKMPIPSFEKAGPRQKIYFDPSKTRAAIVNCGGLCPGINNVIRSLVRTLSLGYGVNTIFGIRYGYEGFIPSFGHEPMMLDTDVVDDIHIKGGSVLGSSRGPQPVEDIVDCLDRLHIGILFTIGGDGTLRGALEVHEEIEKRGLKISVIGIPKTIDNDISFVQKTFGLETAFAIAAEAIRTAHAEAKGAPFGIGLVKVMGRQSGFIAAHAALALNEVNFVLIPEIPFDLEGAMGLYQILANRFNRGKDHSVILVAEGAGQELLKKNAGTDASGNPRLGDIGTFLRDSIKRHFREELEIPVNLKYIDPSYMVRAMPANAHDSIFCVQLAQNAAHAGMAGKTGMIISIWHSCLVHVPIKLATAKKKKDLSGEFSLALRRLRNGAAHRHGEWLNG